MQHVSSRVEAVCDRQLAVPHPAPRPRSVCTPPALHRPPAPLHQAMPGTLPSCSPWILPEPAGAAQAGAPPPRLSLLAFPPAGSGACVFWQGFQRALPPGVQLLPVELPGHNSRLREAPMGSMDELIE